MTHREQLCVHLAGSVPLVDAETVFRTVSAGIGPYLRRIPDGETGARRRWLGMLREILERHPSLEPDQDEPPFVMKSVEGKVLRELRRLRARPGIDPQLIRFETGYAAMAIDSFAIFDRLQRDGVIAQHIKFQISIPSPLAPAYSYISRRHRDAFLEIFTNHLIDEVRQIAMALPNERVAIQWDVMQEILVCENYFPDRDEQYKIQIATILGIIGDAVPQPIELGYHLFYGQSQHEYLVQPRDASSIVEIMRATRKHVRRPIQYFHFPVPQDCKADFLRPYAALSLPSGTELYAGLIHLNDDAGNRKRLELARQFMPVTGVASECGWGRCDPAHVDALIETTHKLVTA